MKGVDGMGNGLNARGLSQSEIQAAIDERVRTKNFTLQDYEEQRIRLVEEIGRLLAQLDNGFAAEMLNIIKEHHPDLFNK